jgi:hypothetical protein
MARGMARGAKEERRAERTHVHQRAHSRAAADGHHADMMSRMKTLTAMFCSSLIVDARYLHT